jgi:hypothetical protein
MTTRPLSLLAASLLALSVAVSTTRAEEACSPEAYQQSLARGSVCSEARAVITPDGVTALRTRGASRERVTAALVALIHAASEDAALDAYFRRQFVRAVELALAREGATAPADMLELDGSSVADCGCEHVATGMPDAPLCFRLATTAPRGPECSLPVTHVITFDASQAGVTRAVRHEAYLDLAYAGLQALNREGREVTHAALASSQRDWQRYRRGYFQLPWELALNGRLERRRPHLRGCTTPQGLGPCRVQYVMLHPLTAVGVQLAGIGAGPFTRRAVATLGVDVLGAVAYTSGFRHHLGAALALGFDNLVFEDPRLGLTLHLTRFLQLSYLTSVRPSTRGDGTLLIGGNVASWVHGLLQ